MILSLLAKALVRETQAAQVAALKAELAAEKEDRKRARDAVARAREVEAETIDRLRKAINTAIPRLHERSLAPFHETAALLRAALDGKP